MIAAVASLGSTMALDRTAHMICAPGSLLLHVAWRPMAARTLIFSITQEA